jgi:hypothetical protein
VPVSAVPPGKNVAVKLPDHVVAPLAGVVGYVVKMIFSAVALLM